MRFPIWKVTGRFVLLLILTLYNVACTNLLFQPSREMTPIPKKYNIEYHDFHFRSEDGLLLHGWYLPAKPKNGIPKRHKKILFLHGNAVNISSHVAAVAWLPAYGYDAYIFGGPTYFEQPTEEMKHFLFMVREADLK